MDARFTDVLGSGFLSFHGYRLIHCPRVKSYSDIDKVSTTWLFVRWRLGARGSL